VAATLVSSLARPVYFAGKEVSVSVSIGVETAIAAGMDTEVLMQHADVALYQAKKRGRNCFEVFANGREESPPEKERRIR